MLTRQWRDARNGVEFEFWLSTDSGPVKLIVQQQQVLFFVAESQQQQVVALLKDVPGWICKPVALKDFANETVVAFYFQSQRQLREARERLFANLLNPLESDINPYDRFLMERFVRGSLRFRGQARRYQQFLSLTQVDVMEGDYLPQLKCLSLDIETAIDEIKLYSIGVYACEAGSDDTREIRKVFMLSPEPVGEAVEIFPNEKALLEGFLNWLQAYDPDVIMGWNIVNFDMWYLQKVCDKYRLAFSCGRGDKRKEKTVHWRVLDEESERRALTVPGRVVLDGIELLKAAFYQFESFSLNNVAGELLGDAKLIQGSGRGEKITELFLQDKATLADYNLQDCKLVWDIFEKTQLLDFAIARTRMTGLPLDRIGGSVASFDFRYLPMLHREGYVAPNSHLAEEIEHSPGGFVMNSQPGIYNNVAVLDFKSLYPSIIRSFKIDPMGMAIAQHGDFDQSELVPGFKGAWFAKHNNILPGLIDELWRLRDEAKAKKDSALSQAIKIIMNSFYGVLGSGGCRFFDTKLASSITRRGHQIIQQTAEYIEQQGWPVIYGDTDSVFVWLKNINESTEAGRIASQLEQQLNRWWREKLNREYAIESALEIEFETLYQRFLMPTIRGSELGSKKRYAGVVLKQGKPELVFKGLENVRTDWTRLAREFQSELYRRVFFNEPYRDYIKQLVQQVLAGERDSELVYRKRLRRRLHEYQRNIPPHVQAARKAVMNSGETIRRGDWIEYLITVNGAEPLSSRQSLINYQHYIDRQLAPVADGILYFLGESLEQIIDQQLGLFE